MATQEKIAAVSELKELFEASNAVILTEYRGLCCTAQGAASRTRCRDRDTPW